ncbi:hypothetical protein Tco_1087752 [Tanacetum coccineum]
MENANPYVPISPNGLRARISQELYKLRAISAMINSHLQKVDYAISPNEIYMDDLEFEDKLIDTTLVSPLLDSNDKSDDGEVIDESEEYRNAGNLYPSRIINSFYREDLAFSYMIGFWKFVAYFDPFLPINIIKRKAYKPPVTYPEEVEETLGTPMEVEPLDQTKLEDVSLTNHNISFSSKEIPSVDELKP